MRRELVASVALILALGLGVACAMRETAIPVIPEVEAQRQQEAAEAADVEVADATTALVSGQPVHQFFADTCGGCHGPQREGGTGPALIPGRLDQPPEFYADVIRNGRPGTIMPPWGAAMAEEDIDTLV